MNSSGIKRGLAVSAVAAMTLTGVAFTAGSANAVVPGANFLSLYSGTGSMLNDGTDSSIDLVAVGNDPATVAVQFSYSTDGGTTWTPIGNPVSASNGVYSTSWAPTTLPSSSVKVQAQGLNSVGNPVGSASVADGGSNVTVNSTSSSVALTQGGQQIGAYKQPAESYNSGGTHNYGNRQIAIASGTASGNASSVTLRDLTPGASNPSTNTPLPSTTGASQSFNAPVDVTGESVPATGVPNWVQIGANDSSDDVQSVQIYSQNVTKVTAVPDSATVALGTFGSGSDNVTVTVTDQNGNPIAGALVGDEGTSYGNQKLQATNAEGQTTFTMNHTFLDGATTSENYFVDTNGNHTYDSTVDFQSTATVNWYTPTESAISTSTTDPSVIDQDETGGTWTVTTKDQNGSVFGNGAFNYTWTFVPTNTAHPATTSAAASSTTNSSGVRTLTPPSESEPGTLTLNAWIESDGSPGETSGDTQANATAVEEGQASFSWKNASQDAPILHSTNQTISAPEGSTTTFTGTLALADGSPLANRTATVALAAVGTGDAQFAATQPSGTTKISNTGVRVTTDANGQFQVSVVDVTDGTPTAPVSEKDTLTPQTQTVAGLGNANASTNTLTIDFHDATPASATGLAVSSTDMSPLGLIGTAAHAPGTVHALTGGVHVANAAGDPLAGVPVTLTLDHGYFTKLDASGQPVPDGPAVGGQVGTWENEGKTITVTTDGSGVAYFNHPNGYAIAIGRDSAFDSSANGWVTSDITVKAASYTNPTDPTYNWGDNHPVNPGSLSLAFAPAADQDSTVLPKARTNDQDVYLQETLTDQFGNVLVHSNDAALLNAPTEDSSNASVSKSGANQLDAWSNDVANDETVSIASAALTTHVWKNTGTPSVPVWTVDGTGSKTLTASAPTINWYVLDYATSTFTLTHNTANTVAPGTSVIETYKALDQNGQPIEGLGVNFLRSGPDDLQNGNYSGVGETGNDGTATYVFQGTKAGKADITAITGTYVPGTPPSITNPVAATQATDVVTFATPAPPVVKPVAIKVKVSAKNAKNGNDVLTVKASSAKAKGATVTVYKVVKGKDVKIGTVKLNAKGVATKTISDHTKKEKKAKTTYVVKVAATKATKAATSNKVTIK